MKFWASSGKLLMSVDVIGPIRKKIVNGFGKFLAVSKRYKLVAYNQPKITHVDF